MDNIRLTAANAAKEVVDLHVLIQNCFCARISNINEAQKEFLSHFHNDFCMITPGGVMLGKNGLANWFSSAVGTRLGNEIKIVNFASHAVTKENITVTYIEEQRFAAEFLRRISTAILTQEQLTGKLLWLHLHETWLSS